jgi:hypothetical protein
MDIICDSCMLVLQFSFMCHNIGLHCQVIFCLYLLYMILFGANFQVFSTFGFVHKIATFEKAAGFQVS